ncbi:MAG: nucleotidyl transferase AbiEii/AbiGii toxin family protein [Burkholderiales bacterium]|jgi:predicted nucleotidyltransferase|nr:nucleotidyl transferase AbiEii/AbiGii toxin family protein [Burkholderiales bacterium]
MVECSRPATLDDLKTWLHRLEEHKIEFLLIGGNALAAHGYYRATTDIDVVVSSTAETGKRVKEALMTLPDQAAKEIDPKRFEEGENIRAADTFTVDIMLNANGHTYDTLSRYAETVDLDGVPVRTISLEGLLLTKQTGRGKNKSDWAIIERALGLAEERRQKENDEAVS